LGCPHCYSVYEPQLRGLLRRIHGATQHVGKVYLPPDTAEADRTARLAGLRRKLQRAVEAEDFERAAELRDQIRALERSAD
jgi:protein arginine kinase activator